MHNIFRKRPQGAIRSIPIYCRRPRRTNLAIAALSLIIGGWGLAAPPAAAVVVRPSVSTTIYNVTAYGAIGDGTTDATGPTAAAILAAQTNGGGTVYFPAGSFAFTQKLGTFESSIQIHGTVPIIMAGAGSSSTRLIEEVANQSLLSVRADGTSVQDLTLDTQSFGGRTAIGVQANNTVLQRATVLGGANQFALYYTGPPGAKPTSPTYNTGNQILDTTVNDQLSGDGISFSFQQSALIQNLTHTGSRLALYVDSNVTVNGDRYSPGTQSNGTDGFWITPPSSGITINGFVTSGRGGIIGSGNPKTSTNITINNEMFLAAGGYHLDVGNVNGLTITGSSFNLANSLRLAPSSSDTNVLVQGSTVPSIRFSQPKTATVNVAFSNCTFPALTLNGRPAPTFLNNTGGTATVSITGGVWSNQAGRFFKGSNTTFTVSNLTGYP